VKIRVLVTDDSLFMRAAIKKLLERDGRFEVVGEAKDGKDAIDKVRALRPDVCTMDFNMPVLDGISALREIMRTRPTPVVMLSAHTREGARETIDALREGAVDFVTKPSGEVSAELGEVAPILIAKLVAASQAKLAPPAQTSSALAPLATPARNLNTTIPPFGSPLAYGMRVVVVAVSTGGPAALSRLLPAIPAESPLALLIVQHLPAGFTGPLADRLDGMSPFTVREAVDGDRATPGMALIAPGDRHLDIHSDGRLHVVEGPEVNGVRPAADITMRAAARLYGRRCVGVVMTGMGRDGADGIRAIKEAGGQTLVQDQASSVIYGMPRAALETGCVDQTLPLDRLADALCHIG
jgi:two-component system, chemotaxis family, protein-glutamate methylesterase/glutaminase